MKKILAILAVLCLGLMIMPTVHGANEGLISMEWENYEWRGIAVQISNNSVKGYNPYFGNVYIANETDAQHRWILNFPSFEVNRNEVVNFTFKVNPVAMTEPGNISAHALVHPQAGSLYHDQANWTLAKTGTAWNSPGGDYDQTPLDTKYIDQAGVYYSYDLTNYLDLSQGDQIGIIFIGDFESNITFQAIHTLMKWQLTIAGGLGQSTDIEKDQWNLEGFSNVTAKLASVIYSEIANCKALVYKNATSGYYYTYAPTWGSLEDYNINYGDGLFILTTANTTWDHT